MKANRLFGVGLAAAVVSGSALGAVQVGAVKATGTRWNYLGTDAFPADARPQVEVTMTPGEYEPASFVVRADEALVGLKPSVDDLTDEQGRAFPSSAIDFRVVKVMARASRKGTQLKPPVLKASVLLHDDAMVKTDEAEKKSYLRVNLPWNAGTYYRSIMNIVTTNRVNLADAAKSAKEWDVRDAKTIQPLDLPANRLQRYWITVKAPEKAAAGVYRGEIALAANGGVVATLPISIRVLPYALPARGSRFGDLSQEYITGLFWSADDIDFRPKAVGSITNVGRNESQVRAEAKNIIEHGIDYPEMCFKLPLPWVSRSRRRVMEPTAEDLEYMLRFFGILKDAGFRLKPLYLNATPGCCGFYENFQKDNPEHRTWLRQALDGQRKIVRDLVGHEDFYVFGIDEANNEKITAEYGFWETVREFGGQNYVSNHPTNIWRVCDHVKMDLVAYEPLKKWADMMHVKGGKLTLYGHPQAELQGQAYPFRVSYGFKCYLADYDGFMIYHYNESGHNGWEEFSTWRSIYYGYVYQTADGVVDTPSWEGNREGIDDVRYATKMMQEIARVEADDAAPAEKKALAREAKAWISSLNVKTGWWDPDSDSNPKLLARGYDFDPDATRAKIIDYTLRLMQ